MLTCMLGARDACLFFLMATPPFSTKELEFKCEQMFVQIPHYRKPKWWDLNKTSLYCPALMFVLTY